MSSDNLGLLLRGYGTRILMYHSIGAIVDGDIHGIYSIDKAHFYSQMNSLMESTDFKVVQLGDDIGNSNDVVITFDDGFYDTYEIAAPILTDLKFPFTILSL